MSSNTIGAGTLYGSGSAGPASPKKWTGRWMFSMRRRYVIDRPYQFKALLLSMYTALLPLVAFNVLGFLHGRTVAELTLSAAPQLQEQMLRYQRNTMLAYLAFTVLFFAGLAWLKILESHRTAGPAYRLSRSLEQVRDGQYDLTVRLRKTDHLGEVADNFNDALQSIRHREGREIAELNELVSELASIAPEAAKRLARLSSQKQDRLV